MNTKNKQNKVNPPDGYSRGIPLADALVVNADPLTDGYSRGIPLAGALVPNTSALSANSLNGYSRGIPLAGALVPPPADALVTNDGTVSEKHQITVNDLVVDVVRRDIKHLHLGVYPPSGRVRVAAPLRVNDEAVRLFTISRLAWIRRQQAKFAEQERQTAREYVSGESHYYLGHRYLLNVVYRDAPPAVTIRNNRTLDLFVRPDSDLDTRKRVLHTWYRRRLKEQIAPLISKWEPIIGVQVSQWGVKQMKTRWGTCNIEAQRIWLNLELIKKPPHCLEYIVVHEMVHLLERHHNERFIVYMNRFMPLWHHYREELNKAPLAHETWEY